MIPGQATRDLHLFLLWERARDRSDEILDDIARRFTILEVLEIEWSRDRFSENLTRFYGQALPPGSDKEAHCGTGPFLLVVVEDPDPAYERRRLPRVSRVVNVHTLEAKERYRRWTGGGHRVHATLDPQEAARDLFLLLGRRPGDYETSPPWDGLVVARREDLVGARGWSDREQLLTALEVALDHAVAGSPPGDGPRLLLEVDDAWWAAVIANGRPGLRDPSASVHSVEVAGEPLALKLVERPGRGPRDERRAARSSADAVLARTLELVARGRRPPLGVALVYHRLAERSGDPSRELVAPVAVADFEAQVGLLARRYRVVPAADLVAAARERRRGGRLPVALTFDDDLRSHVEIAAPLLAQAGLPATFFFSGATLDAPFAFWWDDLQFLVDRRGLDPEQLDPVPRAELERALDRVPGALGRVASAIERLRPPERERIASLLRELRGGEGVEVGPTPEDVQGLARAGFEIGFHTLRHDLLSTLGERELAAAMAEGRSRLEELAGNRLRLIAYPHGKADDRTAEAARSAGFRFGFTGLSQAVHPEANPLLLPRHELRAGPRPFPLALARAYLIGAHDRR